MNIVTATCVVILEIDESICKYLVYSYYKGLSTADDNDHKKVDVNANGIHLTNMRQEVLTLHH